MCMTNSVTKFRMGAFRRIVSIQLMQSPDLLLLFAAARSGHERRMLMYQGETRFALAYWRKACNIRDA